LCLMLIGASHDILNLANEQSNTLSKLGVQKKFHVKT
jgi:hypothetical protein